MDQTNLCVQNLGSSGVPDRVTLCVSADLKLVILFLLFTLKVSFLEYSVLQIDRLFEFKLIFNFLFCTDYKHCCNLYAHQPSLTFWLLVY